MRTNVQLSPDNALKLSAWLALHEPGFFSLVLAEAAGRNPHAPLGFFGDDSALTEFTPDTTVTVTADSTPDLSFTPDLPPMMGTSSGVDLSSFTPELQDISVNPDSGLGGSFSSSSIVDAVSQPPAPDPSTADASPGFWSSVGSGLGTAAAAVGKAAQALISPQVVGSLASAAGAYYAAQARSNVAQSTLQAQQMALQTQLARAQAGLAPAPITYVRNPTTGQTVPVYASNAGAQPLTGALASLLTPTTLGETPTIVWIGAGLLLLLILSSSRNRS